MKKLSGLLTSLSLIVLLTACSTGLNIDADANGKTITLPVGQTLTIRLAGNITTGYGWQVLSVEESILKVDGEPEYKSESKKIGAGGEFILTFQAQSPGETNLELGYLRPWEENEIPLETFQITVVVK